MYKKFKWLLEEAECIGKVVTADMYENGYCAITVVDENGEKIRLTINKEEGRL